MSDIFYGCYLNQSQRWHCKKFNSIQEADEYAFQGKSPITRLIAIKRYVPKILHNRIILKRTRLNVVIE
jgi:hypothetical protein